MPSNCTGVKKAVLIGINYANSKQKTLKSSVMDTWTLHQELRSAWSFRSAKIRVYTDEEIDETNFDGGTFDTYSATRSDIMGAMRWLLKDAKRNDSLFFYFSGHGGYNRQSRICTEDEPIYAEELRERLIDRLPAGCRLTAMFDCCRAGNILGLKYGYSTLDDLTYHDPNVLPAYRDITDLDVVCWSGSDIDSNAQDSKSGVGNMSIAFVTAVGSRGTTSYLQMLENLQEKCQDPHLFTSQRVQNGHQLLKM